MTPTADLMKLAAELVRTMDAGEDSRDAFLALKSALSAPGEARVGGEDMPELDGTDGAHPAWWRGHHHTALVMCQKVNEILDGKDTGAGTANEPWESTRQRLRALAGPRAGLGEDDAIRVVRLAYDAMNYLGDILNGHDMVEPEDEAKTAPAFEAVRAFLALAAPAQPASDCDACGGSGYTTRPSGNHACWKCATPAQPKASCTCPSGDGSLRWPCPVHPQEQPKASEGRAGGEEVVGHKTFDDGRGGFRHEPLTRAEADVLIAHCKSEDERRKALMPDERSAIRMMMDAHTRLTDMGWKDPVYCPKDGSTFEVIEPGSTGIHKCIYMGDWPNGSWWALDAGDMYPSRPVLFRPMAATLTAPGADDEQ